MVIGDGDSVDRAELEKLAVLRIMGDQETNDLTKAVDYAASTRLARSRYRGGYRQTTKTHTREYLFAPDYYKRSKCVSIVHLV